MIKLNVVHTGITASNRETLIAGNVNSISVEFGFSEDWDGLTRIAVFSNGSTRRSVLLDGNTCPIPWEVLARAGRLFVSVRGIGSEGAFLLCTEDEFLGCVLESSASDTVSEAAEATPDVFDSLLARVNGLTDGGTDILTVHYDGTEGSADKTFAEIQAAKLAGKAVQLYCGNGIYGLDSLTANLLAVFRKHNISGNSAADSIITCTNADVWSATTAGFSFNPVDKTAAMTQPVGRDNLGRLFTEPGGEAPSEVESAIETGGLGWTEDDETVHQIDSKYLQDALGPVDEALDGILALIGGD